MLRFLPAITLLLSACNGASAGGGGGGGVAVHAQAESVKAPELQVETLAEGFDHPWDLAFLPDGTMLVTVRSGQLRHVSPDGTVSVPISGVPEVFAENQSGLLDVLLHPNFAENRQLYLSYGSRCAQGGATSAVTRARLTDNNGTLRLAEAEEVLRANACHRGGRHMAGRMVFDDAGHLFVAIGDRGIGEAENNAAVQDTSNHVGTVLRLNEDGSPAAGNPFAEGGGDPKIFTYGHRNIQGMALHPETGAVWTHEHGPRGGDEINILEAGTNYGWPEITYGRHYSGGEIGPPAAEGLAQPALYWKPSIAPSGMAFIARDGAMPADWQGDLIVGALKAQLLSRLRWDIEAGRLEEVARHFSNEFGRIRTVKSGPGGALYLLTDSANGKLLRLIARE